MKLLRIAAAFSKDLMSISLFHNGLGWGFINTVLLAVCFLVFQQADLLATAGPSLSILNGHILDYYDYVTPGWGLMSYMPSTYFLFALWNLPLKLFGIMPPLDQIQPPFIYIMYYKAASAVAYFLCAWIIYKIFRLVICDDKNARLNAFIWFGTPIALFSPFIFGQYDAFTLTFTLAGIYYYLKDKRFPFILFFGIALTFKYYSLLVFFPLLLLKEKRIEILIRDISLYFLPILISITPYLPSEAFRQGVFGFGAPNFILFAQLDLHYLSLKLFVLLWISIVAWAYFTDTAEKVDLFAWMNYFCCLVMSLLFGFSMFHPQWLVFATPFWVMSSVFNKRRDFFLWLDILMMLMFTIFTVNMYVNHVDQNLFNLGLLKHYSIPVAGYYVTMRDIFILTDKSLSFSFLSGLILIQAIFKHPKYSKNTYVDVPIWLTQVRFIGGLSIFVVPAFLSLAFSLIGPRITFARQQIPLVPTRPLFAGDSLSQVFTSESETLDELQVRIGTYARVNHSRYQVEILNSLGENLFKQDYPASTLVDNAYQTICLPQIPLSPGSQYEIRFTSSDTSASDFVSLYQTVDNIEQVKDFAVYNGSPQPYDLDVRVYGSSSQWKYSKRLFPCRN